VTHSAYPLLRPTLDVVFKMLFASQRGRRSLIALLNAALKPPSPISSVEVLNPDIPKLLVDDKATVLDIHARLFDGTLIDIEMQMASHPGLARRALFYASKMYTSELSVGHLYTELRPVVVLFFLAEDIFPSRTRDFAVSFSVQQDDQGPAVFQELRGQFTIKFFEIHKAFQLWQARQISPNDVDLGGWLGFLADPDSKTVEELCLSMPELKEAKATLEEISADKEAREVARIREKSRLHMDSILAEARQQGKLEGREEGLQKGREEGIQEGTAEGKKQGRLEQSLAILERLLSDPNSAWMSDAQLVVITGLDAEEVVRVRRELEKSRD
jgi:predicted transposase/invertase (TIGR01784 family)